MQTIKFFCALATMLISLCTNAKEEITWAVANWQPYFIAEGKYKGQGVGDKFTDYFIDRMPYFDHYKTQMTWARVDREAKLGRTTCMTNRFYTEERAQHSLFTKPYSLSLSQRLFMRKETYQRLGQPKNLSIKYINEELKLEGVIESNRSYGEKLDPLIDRYLLEPQLRRKQVSSVKLLNMLLSGRMDYFIEYPLNISYLAQTENISTEKFVNVEISESPEYVLSWISCSKTDLGSIVIDRLNRVIDSEKADQEYWQRIKHWLSDKDSAKLEHYYRERFLSLAQ